MFRQVMRARAEPSTMILLNERGSKAIPDDLLLKLEINVSLVLIREASVCSR